MPFRRLLLPPLTFPVLAGGPSAARAQSSLHGATLIIVRTAGPVTIDGDLSEPAWRHAAKIEKWYEINPGDNTEPDCEERRVPHVRRRFVYAAFEFEDPDPSSIRAPLADHDNVPDRTAFSADRSNVLEGLAGLPSGGHIVAAPYRRAS